MKTPSRRSLSIIICAFTLRARQPGVTALGPVRQSDFLFSMGMAERLQSLIEHPDTSDEQVRSQTQRRAHLDRALSSVGSLPTPMRERVQFLRGPLPVSQSHHFPAAASLTGAELVQRVRTPRGPSANGGEVQSSRGRRFTAAPPACWVRLMLSASRRLDR